MLTEVDMEGTQVPRKHHCNACQHSQNGSQGWKHMVWDSTSKHSQGCITGGSVGGIGTVLAEAIMVSKEEDKEGQIVE